MRKIFKNLVWEVLYTFAALIPHSPRCAVLLYHSISESKDFFAVSPKEFERQMRYLQKHANTIALDKVTSFLKGEYIFHDSFAITFDDGYADFVHEALPILERLDIPATVFVLGEDHQVDRGELGNSLPLIAREDVSRLASPLVTIGSHGISHRKLPKISPEESREEIVSSRARIKEMHGVDAKYFAYPKGSWNPEVAKTVQEAGYAAAFTVIETSVPRNTNHYAVPRVQIDSSTSFLEFKAKLTPAADWYYRLWRFFRKGML